MWTKKGCISRLRLRSLKCDRSCRPFMMCWHCKYYSIYSRKTAISPKMCVFVCVYSLDGVLLVDPEYLKDRKGMKLEDRLKVRNSLIY